MVKNAKQLPPLQYFIMGIYIIDQAQLKALCQYYV